MAKTTGTERTDDQADAIRPFPKVSFPEAELTELRTLVRRFESFSNHTGWQRRKRVPPACVC